MSYLQELAVKERLGHTLLYLFTHFSESSFSNTALIVISIYLKYLSHNIITLSKTDKLSNIYGCTKYSKIFKPTQRLLLSLIGPDQKPCTS